MYGSCDADSTDGSRTSEVVFGADESDIDYMSCAVRDVEKPEGFNGADLGLQKHHQKRS